MSFFSNIVNNSSNVKNMIQEIKNDKKNNIPLFFYGAGSRALELEKYLNKFGISVDLFFVGKEYLDDPSLCCREVCSVDEIFLENKKFNVVIARGDIEDARLVLKNSDNREQVNAIYVFPLSGMDFEYVNKNKKSFEQVYDILEDSLSKDILIKIINFKLQSETKFFSGISCQDQYFQNDLFDMSKNEIFVDGGAFVGDTLISFMQKFENKFTKYYAFEPDSANFKKLNQEISKMNLRNIFVFPKGLWSQSGVLDFAMGRGFSSSLCEASSLSPEDRVYYIKDEIISIQVDTIDNLCPDATFIKMDIEGAELEALKGAAETIRRNRPKLAICVYHKPEHLFEIPLYIHSLVPEYRLYLRHHSELETETVLYAVP